MGWSFRAICQYINYGRRGIGLWQNKYFCEHLGGQQRQIICVLYLISRPSSTVIREQATWCKLMDLYEFVRGKGK